MLDAHLLFGLISYIRKYTAILKFYSALSVPHGEVENRQPVFDFLTAR